MKATDLRDLPSDELASRLSETKEELFNLRFQHATGQLENYGQLGQVRRDVARMLSLQRERVLGLSPEPSAEQAEASRRRRAEADEAAEAAEDEGRRRRRRGLRRGRGEADDGEVSEAGEAGPEESEDEVATGEAEEDGEAAPDEDEPDDDVDGEET